MQEIDGPYRNTRSSAGSLGKVSDKSSHLEDTGNTPEVFWDNKGQCTPSSTNKEKTKERNRTPSGHFITNSVGDIRKFFTAKEKNSSASSPKESARKLKFDEIIGAKLKATTLTPIVKEKPVSKCDSDRDSDGVHDQQSKQLRNKHTADTYSPTIECSLNPNSIHTFINNWNPSERCGANFTSGKDNNSQIHNTECELYTQKRSFTNTDNTKVSDSNSIYFEDQRSTRLSHIDDTTSAIGEKDIRQDMEPESNINSGEIPTDPKTMDLQIVIQLFKEIKRDLHEFKKDIPVDKVKNLVTQEKSNADIILKLQEELKDEKCSKQLMSGTIQRMSTVITDMEARITELEKSNNRNSLVLTGFPNNVDRKERKTQITLFIKDTLNINAEIAETYLIGEGVDRPVVIVFSSIQDRNSVFYNRTKLKNYSNLEDKPFYINELLPPALNEKRRCERQIVNENKRNTAQKIEMSFARGGLRIQNELYVKKVVEPKPEDFLKLSTEEVKDIMSTKIEVGKQISEMSSTFTGYSIKVKTHQQIRRAYTKMKLGFPGARHIMCGYRIEGPEKHFTEDACDDGEHAGGQVILNYLTSSRIMNCAIFVVRQYGGTKIGKKRFDIIRQAAEYAVQKLKDVEIETIKDTGDGNKDDKSTKGKPTKRKTYTPRQDEIDLTESYRNEDTDNVKNPLYSEILQAS